MIVALLGLALAASGRADYLCNYAKVNAQLVTVRARHDDRAKPVAKLSGGAVVYICDEYRNEDLTNRWVHVSFSTFGKPCRGGTTNGLRMHSAADCRRGWVRERYVDVLSG